MKSLMKMLLLSFTVFFALGCASTSLDTTTSSSGDVKEDQAKNDSEDNQRWMRNYETGFER